MPVDGELPFGVHHDFAAFAAAGVFPVDEFAPVNSRFLADLTSPELGVVVSDEDVGAPIPVMPESAPKPSGGGARLWRSLAVVFYLEGAEDADPLGPGGDGAFIYVYIYIPIRPA